MPVFFQGNIMLMAELPIAVIMQRRVLDNPWVDHVWSAKSIVRNPGNLPPIECLSRTLSEESYLISGLQLELYPDEDEGYFENWAAPEPKVFVMWRMQNGLALPVISSVSYGEGTRMLDSGESADGVVMPPDIHAWLGSYLKANYRPKPKGKSHHG
jgi:hypothetical protein